MKRSGMKKAFSALVIAFHLAVWESSPTAVIDTSTFDVTIILLYPLPIKKAGSITTAVRKVTAKLVFRTLTK